MICEPYGPLPVVSPTAEAEAGPQVIWATGGLRGITATCALALARRLTLAEVVLIGRGAGAEPDWAIGVPEADLQAAAVGALGKDADIRDLRAAVGKARRARQESETLAAFAEAGISVHPLRADIGDAEALADALAGLPEALRLPRIVIHGAGALADRRLPDKRREDFETVWRPKVDGLDALLAQVPQAAPPERVLLFGSTAGTFGNVGQADYAAANEVLADAAHRLSARPGCRATAIAWGPWSGGMVTPALEAQFRARGIAAIAPEQGAALFADIAASDCGPVVIVDGGMARRAAPDVLRFSRREEPVLEEHCLHGKPVLPAAWAAARMARASGTSCIEGFEVGCGLPLDGQERELWCSVDGGVWSLTRDDGLAFKGRPGAQDGASAAEWLEVPISAPELEVAGYLSGAIGYGPAFARIRRAWRSDPDTILTEIAPLPKLPYWPGLINPLIYDLATHGVLLHVWETDRLSCLPRRSERVTWHRAPRPDVPLLGRTVILADTDGTILCDLDVHDPEHGLVFDIAGFEAFRHAPRTTGRQDGVLATAGAGG